MRVTDSFCKEVSSAVIVLLARELGVEAAFLYNAGYLAVDVNHPAWVARPANKMDHPPSMSVT